MSEAEDWMNTVQRIVFMGTSFGVNMSDVSAYRKDLGV
jgi:hypothetical protein